MHEGGVGAPITSPAVCVVVASDQALVAETVANALSARGFDVVLLDWMSSGVESATPDVGLLVSELTSGSWIREAQRVLESLAVPWLVQTTAACKPAWGAMLEAGASLVVTESTLHEISTLLPDVSAGRLATAEHTRRELIALWHHHVEAREQLAGRVQALTEREEWVLRLMHAGVSAPTIAEQLGETTFRVSTHVDTILRKLGVGSHLAAVAAYDAMLTPSDQLQDQRTGDPAPPAS